MNPQSILATNLNRLIQRTGTPIRVQYFTSSIGSVWDDDATYTVSGNGVWSSGIVLPINASRGSFDSLLMEQGKIINGDIRLFTHGSLIMTGSFFAIRIQIGSPNGLQYSMIQDGANQSNVSNIPIYKKVFLRQLQGSTLYGE